ncbi:MAG TPA: GT4 family glycosyltransferase PelF [Kofleriaceae bacterium]|jgi:glycosyltransferase involved in cell wall biosynthesis|nr:GT4 family glycosyltransferase PelF [Kofleriaceae bacterium]
MDRRSATAIAPRAQVCLLLEGTYPYVAGGVSSWVHRIVSDLPEVSFALLHIGAVRGSYGAPRYTVPANVTELSELYCQTGPSPGPADLAARRELERRIHRVRRHRGPVSASRTLAALRRMHLGEGVDDALVSDLARADLSIAELLHSDAAFAVITELYERLAPDAAFLDFFWHFRAMHAPLLRLLAAPVPDADSYHTVSTGYAGLVGAVASVRTNRPLLLTEHGFYTRERDIELSRAAWIRDPDPGDPRIPNPRPSPLRRFWSRGFAALSRIAYHQAQSIVSLGDNLRQQQMSYGAPADKLLVIPNGVAVPASAVGATGKRAPADPAEPADPADPGDRSRALRVGFVGRVVPIKDVATFIKACDLALRSVNLDVHIIGPDDEDPAYARRCKALVAMLARESHIRFVGPKPAAQIYAELDVVVLTSFSESQPLVILEAGAAGLPVIATDVGVCREMLEGRTGDDRALGPSGRVTRVADPEDTAAALTELAGSPRLRAELGEAGRARVHAYYRSNQMIDRYRALYRATLEA